MGCWNGRTDSPVHITWSSVKVKVLGVFLGLGNLEEDNWRPRIIAVGNALNSWRQQSLSYKGKALVSIALPLSCVWCVASLIHVPQWVSVELNTLSFSAAVSGTWLLVVLLFNLLVDWWVVFLRLIFSVRLWLCMFSGFISLFLLRLLGSLSWFFGFLPCFFFFPTPTLLNIHTCS